jgi:hypothetical protein
MGASKNKGEGETAHYRPFDSNYLTKLMASGGEISLLAKLTLSTNPVEPVPVGRLFMLTLTFAGLHVVLSLKREKAELVCALFTEKD